MSYRYIKRTFPIVVTIIGIMGFPHQALAEKGDLTASLKYGQAQTSDFKLENGVTLEPDGDTGLGVSIGYEIDTNWTAELMYLQGEATDSDVGRGFAPIDVDSTSIGVYGVYRSKIELGSPYFFGRIGFGQSDLEINQGSVSIKTDDSGVAFGAGAGYQYTEKLAFEAEFFRDSDVFDYVLISARFHIDR